MQVAFCVSALVAQPAPPLGADERMNPPNAMDVAETAHGAQAAPAKKIPKRAGRPAGLAIRTAPQQLAAAPALQRPQLVADASDPRTYHPSYDHDAAPDDAYANGPATIIDGPGGLFLGCARTAADVRALRATGISAVLNVARELDIGMDAAPMPTDAAVSPSLSLFRDASPSSASVPPLLVSRAAQPLVSPSPHMCQPRLSNMKSAAETPSALSATFVPQHSLISPLASPNRTMRPLMTAFGSPTSVFFPSTHSSFFDPVATVPSASAAIASKAAAASKAQPQALANSIPSVTYSAAALTPSRDSCLAAAPKSNLSNTDNTVPQADASQQHQPLSAVSTLPPDTPFTQSRSAFSSMSVPSCAPTLVADANLSPASKAEKEKTVYEQHLSVQSRSQSHHLVSSPSTCTYTSSLDPKQTSSLAATSQFLSTSSLNTAVATPSVLSATNTSFGFFPSSHSFKENASHLGSLPSIPDSFSAIGTSGNDCSMLNALSITSGESNGCDSTVSVSMSVDHEGTKNAPAHSRTSQTASETTTRMPSFVVPPHKQDSSYDGIRYHKLAWSHNQDMSNSIEIAIQLIQQAREEGRSVLVHCQQGVSRSAALVIAYIMKSQKMHFREAYDLVKRRSPHISPNVNLVAQLVAFERRWLNHE